MDTETIVAAVLDSNGVVVNRIVVRSLEAFPEMNLVAGDTCKIGDSWNGTDFVSPPEDPEEETTNT